MSSIIFDHCISNPPYQNDASTERNNTAHNIFHHFYLYGYDTASITTMIFPAGRWMQRSARGGYIANDLYPIVDSIDWYPNSKKDKVFTTAIIHDGVCVASSDASITSNGTIVHNGLRFDRPRGGDIYPLSREGSILVGNILGKYDKFVIDRKESTTVFDLPSRYTEYYRDELVNVDESTPDTVVAYVANDTHGSAKRVERRYIPRGHVQWDSHNEALFKRYKVVTSQGNCAKTPEYTSYSVLDKDTVTGNSWVIVGSFDTLEEAENYKKYLDAPIVRLLLAESKGGKSKCWGYFVPDLGDYTNNNTVVQWEQPLDDQLEKLFNS